MANESPDSATGGLSRSAYEVSRALHERGHTIDLLYRREGDFLPEWESFSRSIHRVRELGVQRRLPLVSLIGTAQAARVGRRSKADVVYVQYPTHDLFAAGVALGADTASVCHLRFRPPPKFGWSNVVMTPTFTRFIAVSHYMKQIWCEAGIDGRYVDVVHNGVEPDRYRPGDPTVIENSRRELGIRPDETVVLFAGRVYPLKGTHLLADAMSLADRPDWRLVIAGAVDPRPSPTESEAYRRALVERAPPNTIFTGPRKDMVALFQAADVVVLPTTIPEPFGRVIIEAMSCGVPVLATDSGGIPEILAGDFARFRIDPTDLDSMVRHIDEIRDWRSREPALGAACREHVVRNFTLEQTMAGIEAAFHIALRGMGGDGPSASRRDMARRGRVN